MIQPTLDHLNPCFDELMENFDFLFCMLFFFLFFFLPFERQPSDLNKTDSTLPTELLYHVTQTSDSFLYIQRSWSGYHDVLFTLFNVSYDLRIKTDTHTIR